LGHKIAIINSSSFGRRFPEQMERLEKIGEVKRFTFPINTSGGELAKALQGFDILISSVTPFFRKDFFDQKDRTILISRHGIGYNNIDVEAATERGTAVTIVAPLVERDAVAENAVANLMALMRRTVAAANAAKEGRWRDRAQFLGHQISGKTVGVIGFGNIGSRVGEILKNGFNTRLLAYDPHLSADEIRRRGAEPAEMEDLLRQADIISLNAMLTEESYHMISDREFGLMKKGVYITNTARGELIDQEAAIRAIEAGIVQGLATDVVEGEPVDETHPYFRYPNILVTPHTSAYTEECLRGMGEKVVSDVERIVSGLIPDNCVNPSVFEK
jgi:D-isomer specific 2-hydroxyacid dehydrogenase, NAD binding domain.